MRKLILAVLFPLFTNQVLGQKANSNSTLPRMSIFAESKNQWTGIAVSKTGRVFVNFPRWSANTPVSVAEIVSGEIIPYPNGDWSNWDKTIIKKHQFICVQSVYVDNLNLLRIPDTGQEP